MLRWLTPLAVFAAVFAVLALLNRSSAPSEDLLAGGADLSAPAAADTEARIAALQEALAEEPENPGLAALLGGAYYQRARETADPAFYNRADQAYAQALSGDPEQIDAITGSATLALARHDFRGGLELAERARALEPDLVSPYAPLIDAQVELGDYRAAGRSIERMLSLRPGLAAYARASYFRELNGDLGGALQAMRLAASAGAGAAESEAFVQSLVGKLLIDQGRYGAAASAYAEALGANPDYAPALAGHARVQAADGNLRAAIRTYGQVVELLPLPEYAIALGEAQEAAGRTAAAERSYALVAVEAKLLNSAGVNTDVDLAIFEADHGSAAKAVALGKSAWESAPSVRSADAYAWALHRAGRDAAAERFSAEAMKLGSRDPSFLYHAGLIARTAGDGEAARRYLGALVDQSPRFSPLHGPVAKRTLAALRLER